MTDYIWQFHCILPRAPDTNQYSCCWNITLLSQLVVIWLNTTLSSIGFSSRNPLWIMHDNGWMDGWFKHNINRHNKCIKTRFWQKAPQQDEASKPHTNAFYFVLQWCIFPNEFAVNPMTTNSEPGGWPRGSYVLWPAGNPSSTAVTHEPWKTCHCANATVIILNCK